MIPKVDWIEVDLRKPKELLPKPLRHQSGGKFWVVYDMGIHGKGMSLEHWTGKEFSGVNNEIITHFANVEWPDYPSVYYEKRIAYVPLP